MIQDTVKPRSTRLNYRQRAFIEHYFVSWNGIEAAQKAGYKAKDLRTAASEILAHPNISGAIEQRLEQLGVGAKESVYRVSQIARGGMSHFIKDGQLDIESEEAKRNYFLVKSFSKDSTTTYDKLGNPIVNERIRLEVYDALAALTLLMKHHNLLASDNPITINQNNLTMTNVVQVLKDNSIDLAELVKELPDVIKLLESNDTKIVEQVVDSESVPSPNEQKSDFTPNNFQISTTPENLEKEKET